MKKSALLLLGAFITLYACDKGPMESGLGMVDMSLTGLSTKVSVGDAGETAWTQGDALSVFTDTDSRDGSTNYRFQLVSSSDGGKSGRFSGKVVENAERSMVYAVYPYSESYASGTASEMEIRIPAEHTIAIRQHERRPIRFVANMSSRSLSNRKNTVAFRGCFLLFICMDTE